MYLQLLPDRSIRLSRLDPWEVRTFRSLPDLADFNGNAAAEKRLLPSPAIESDMTPEMAMDWVEYVVPELRETFAASLKTVMADLEKLHAELESEADVPDEVDEDEEESEREEESEGEEEAEREEETGREEAGEDQDEVEDEDGLCAEEEGDDSHLDAEAEENANNAEEGKEDGRGDGEDDKDSASGLSDDLPADGSSLGGGDYPFKSTPAERGVQKKSGSAPSSLAGGPDDGAEQYWDADDAVAPAESDDAGNAEGETASKWVYSLTIPPDHVEHWFRAMNQARLVLSAKYKIDSEQLPDLARLLEAGSIEYWFQYELFCRLQGWLVAAVLDPE